MTKPLSQRIEESYASLTPSEQRLADALLARQDRLAGYSASELAQSAGVSKATAARLFRRLGYDSFNQARLQARANAHMGSPLWVLGGTPPLPANGGFKAHVGNDLWNLTRTFEALDPAQLEGAVDLLARARRVRVLGFRNGHPLAEYARSVLLYLRDEVDLLPGPGLTLAEELAGLGEGDLLLAMDFRRRTAILEPILKAARRAGAQVVLLTGTGAGAMVRHARVVLRCQHQGASLFDSYVAPMSLLNLLASILAERLGEEARERMEQIEIYHELFQDLEAAHPRRRRSGPDDECA